MFIQRYGNLLNKLTQYWPSLQVFETFLSANMNFDNFQYINFGAVPIETNWNKSNFPHMAAVHSLQQYRYVSMYLGENAEHEFTYYKQESPEWRKDIKIDHMFGTIGTINVTTHLKLLLKNYFLHKTTPFGKNI